MELQTTKELLVSSLSKVQDLEVDFKKVPNLENKIAELEKDLLKQGGGRRR